LAVKKIFAIFIKTAKNFSIYGIIIKNILITKGHAMKLNYKRTFLVGLAFFLIQLFWQCYDTIIPKIMTDKFGMPQTVSGIIMALDNVFALFLLPLFGAISDKCRSKKGRRTPFILIGTVAACILFVSLSFADNMQLSNIDALNAEDGKATLSMLYNEDLGKTSDDIKAEFTEEEFVAIEMYDENGDLTENYTNYVTPARQAYALKQTMNNPAPLILFIVLLLGVLVSMSIFRSPAVALMPDVTPKPLRSKGNAIINLMGTIAGALVLGLGIVFGTGKAENSLMSYTVFFSTVAGLMLIALIVFLATVKEPKWAADAMEESEKAGILDKEKEEAAQESKRHLSKGELRSLIFILLSVAFWYIGYNSVTSKYSVYAGEILNLDYNTTLLIATAIAAVAFVPVAFISSKIGRKKMILVGVALLATSFFAASFMGAGSPLWLMNIFFAMAGIGWAAINVNSFPMVVELATGSDVGRYTGLYYSASMAAQIIAPVFSGVFIDINMRYLFPFGTIFVVFSFITMLFVKHGDSKPAATKENIIDSMGDAD